MIIELVIILLEIFLFLLKIMFYHTVMEIILNCCTASMPLVNKYDFLSVAEIAVKSSAKTLQHFANAESLI